MKKAIAVLLVVIGIIWISCEAAPQNDRSNNDNFADSSGIFQQDVSFQRVTASDGNELLNYLSSSTTAYEIRLNISNPHIYINTDLSITMPMRIIGDPYNIPTIHTRNNEGTPSNFCLDLMADLELQFCSITVYDKITLDSEKDLPPLVIRPGINLIVGMGAALNLEDYPYSFVFPGGTVVVHDGGSFNDKSANGIKAFEGGISNLIIFKTGNAIIGATVVGDTQSDQFQIVEGRFRISSVIDEDAFNEISYVLDGIFNLNSNWALVENRVLHIRNGSLVVSEGIVLNLNKDMGGLILDANIELRNDAGLDLSENVAETIEKFSGRGYIAVEGSGTGAILKGSDLFIGSGESSLFRLLGNARVELNSTAIDLKSGEAEFKLSRGTYDLEKNFIVTAGARLIIASGASLRAPLINRLEGTAPREGLSSKITVMDGAALMIFPADVPYYPDIPATNRPIDLEWNHRNARWVEIP